MKKPEILSPIQDFTSLRVALSAGADAVYFGIRGLNMRAGAKNFSIKDIPQIVKLCKKANTKAYLALNVLVFEKELVKVRRVLQSAKKHGVDAIICFDAAVIQIAREIKLPVHLSTQAGVANTQAAIFYSKMGVERIVLARECSLNDIKKIISEVKKKKIKMSWEVFVHGAMCVSVSGRCFLSEHLHGLSANRGACAQPCRRKYLIKQTDGEHELELGEDYILSPRDLCTLPFLPLLLSSGVDCLKIEGRNRSPEYVAQVTRVYREAVDFYFSEYIKRGGKKIWSEKVKIWEEELKKVYNRGFGTGFYLGKPINQWTHSYGSEATEKKIHLGKIIKYYPKIKVAEIFIEANKKLRLGDKVYIEGEKTGQICVQVNSLQKEHKNIKLAEQGESVAFEVPVVVCRGDKVYKISVKK